MGRGRSVYKQNLGPGWTRIAPHRKEGFQVSKRDLVQGEFSRGVSKGLRRMLSAVILNICIMLLRECG
jgi:hypothetical protein